MSHFKAEMHQIKFQAFFSFVRLSLMVGFQRFVAVDP